MGFSLGSLFMRTLCLLIKIGVRYFPRENDFPIDGVDPKIEVGVTVEEGTDAGLHLHLPQRGNKTRIRVYFELPLTIFVKVIVPVKKIFGDSVIIKGVGLIADFAKVFKGCAETCLSCAVISVKKDKLFDRQFLAQMGCQI